MTRRAGLYVRQSQDRRVMDPSGRLTYTLRGVKGQIEDGRAEATRLGWQIIEPPYEDNDVSAVKAKRRPAFERLVADIESRKIDAIICWHPDRLYRTMRDLTRLIDVVEQHKVAIQTVKAGPVDLTTPTGRLMARVLASIGSYEGEHKSERWRKSFEDRRAAGQPFRAGVRLFGYKPDGTVVEEEAEAIRSAADNVIAGFPLYQIARQFNEAGWSTTRGNPWRRETVRSLLLNPRLAGWVAIKGEPVARSTDSAILTQETWEAVRVMIEGPRGKGKARPRKALLLDLIHCGVCGAPLKSSGRSSKGKTKTYIRTYRCVGPEGGGKGRGCVDIVAEPVEEWVEAWAKGRLADPRVAERLAQYEAADPSHHLAREIDLLEARLLELGDELDDPHGRPVLAVRRAMDRLTDKITATQQKFDEALAAAPPPTGALGPTWPTDLSRRRRLIQVVLRSVEVSPPQRAGGATPPQDRLTLHRRRG